MPLDEDLNNDEVDLRVKAKINNARGSPTSVPSKPYDKSERYKPVSPDDYPPTATWLVMLSVT